MNEDRKQAFLLLHDILTERKFANLTLKTGLNGFSERDKAFICALVYGTLDKLIALDYVLSLYAKGRIQPKVRDLLRMGAYQILYMDRVPDSAAVNTTVALAREIGKGALRSYINGVLRTVSREKNNMIYPGDPAENLSVRYAYPLFLVSDFLEKWGREETESFLSHEGTHE
ncbi:MAG: 16S rRNA (cytosine(967)-C(5))-methyltransferase RsmB, partial [Clostridia bacterium]|nr:16S rRNA (cytosine(967)-C(5))-methyltransferase RsmB [Clostridia bacterium]